MSVGGQPIRGDKLAILLHRYSAEAASQNQLTSRIRVRPPNKFAQDGDILLWLQRFELYVARATIPRTEWAKEVLSLLEDGPFRVVSHLGLADSDDYEAVRKCLQQRYAPEGNELDWQLRLQSRTQKVGEPLEDYVGELCMLVEKAYPNWTSEQQEVLVRNQFIQGLSSSSSQLLLMREMPDTLEGAVKLARKQQSVEEAQKHLRRVKQHGAEAAAMQLPSELEPEDSNAVSQVTSSDNSQLFSLSQQVQHLTETVAQLQLSMLKGKEGTMSSKRSPVCWRCGKEGHLKSDCQQREMADRPTGRGRSRGLKSFAVTGKGTPAVTVEERVR